MHKSILLKSLVILCYSCIFNNNLLAKTNELPFDGSFYMSQICTSYITKNDVEYCDDGYILKSETFNNGKVTETVLMDGMGSYGWNHTSLKKIDKDTYHIYVGCGVSCGANMLFSRGDKKQNFDLYFDFSAKSRCTVEYDNDKKLWIARRFFSDKKIVLPSTYGISESAVQPKYDVEFDKKGGLIVTALMDSNHTFYLPNPCIIR